MAHYPLTKICREPHHREILSFPHSGDAVLILLALNKILPCFLIGLEVRYDEAISCHAFENTKLGNSKFCVLKQYSTTKYMRYYVFAIPFPSRSKYKLGQLYMVARSTLEESSKKSSDGFEILKMSRTLAHSPQDRRNPASIPLSCFTCPKWYPRPLQI